MNKSISLLNEILVNTYGLAVLTQVAHWNVQGSQFFELHRVFGEQYEALTDAVDLIAERIRALDQEALPDPGFLAAHLATLPKFKDNADPVPELLAAHSSLCETLDSAIKTLAGDPATQNMLIERVTYHDKVIWMLKSYLK